ncbi:hypothetical protein GNI_101040 [Gregarina niphandrodes]|uniref:Uncharacterized protein n=1 Tax=Gregarina niphandrodes TaxID=110365 RepID=A0A023B4H2_GRENI|nr:hypothetical protein GNI_101040 [Gregarina niphandrodes]EZG56783.1 hypothetical protein GNI_101040 [Gregarina niphandrodes]|eukprot:XP_011131149.1 hypothetical protein GNI_101040 [Gregarina niphandrodes]
MTGPVSYVVLDAASAPYDCEKLDRILGESGTTVKTTLDELYRETPVLGAAVKSLAMEEASEIYSSVEGSDMSRKDEALLTRLRRRFLSDQAEKGAGMVETRWKTSANTPKYFVRLLAHEKRTYIGKSGMYKVELGSCQSWEVPFGKSVLTFEQWDLPNESLSADELLRFIVENSPIKLEVNINQVVDPDWQQFYRALRLGEVDKLVQDAEDDQKEEAAEGYAILSNCIIKLVSLTDNSYFSCPCATSTPPSTVASASATSASATSASATSASATSASATSASELVEVEEEAAGLSSFSPGFVLRTIRHDEQRQLHQALRTRGLQPPEAGSFVVLKLTGAEQVARHVGFCLYRTFAVPLWFHEIVAKLKPGTNYRLKLVGLSTAIGNAPLAETQPPAEIQYYPLAQDFRRVPFTLRQDGVCTIELPDDVAKFDATGRLDHCKWLPSLSGTDQGDEEFDLSFVGELAKEVNPWEQSILEALSNARGLLKLCWRLGGADMPPFALDAPACLGPAHSAQQGPFMAKVAAQAFDYTRHVLARKLEGDDLERLEDRYGAPEPISTDVPPTVTACYPLLYREYYNWSVFLLITSWVATSGYAKAANIQALVTEMDNGMHKHGMHREDPGVDKGEDFAVYLRCQIYLAHCYFHQSEYEKCIAVCRMIKITYAKYLHGATTQGVEQLFQQASKKHTQSNSQMKAMCRNMFA